MEIIEIFSKEGNRVLVEPGSETEKNFRDQGYSEKNKSKLKTEENTEADAE